MTKYSRKGNSVSNREIQLPCGKTYNGNIKTVDSLLKFHKKICSQCNNCKDGNNIYAYGITDMATKEILQMDNINNLFTDLQSRSI
jgi:hypothetical protein